MRLDHLAKFVVVLVQLNLKFDQDFAPYFVPLVSPWKARDVLLSHASTFF